MAINADTVTVVCKLPHGLVMELLDKNGMPQKAPVTVRGGLNRDAVNGSGITTVTKEFSDEWFRRNRELSCVRNGLVYVVPKLIDAQIEAKDREVTATGLEPINPEKKMKEPAFAGIEKFEKTE